MTCIRLALPPVAPSHPLPGCAVAIGMGGLQDDDNVSVFSHTSSAADAAAGPDGEGRTTPSGLLCFRVKLCKACRAASNSPNPISKGPESQEECLQWSRGTTLSPEGDFCRLCYNTFIRGGPLMHNCHVKSNTCFKPCSALHSYVIAFLSCLHSYGKAAENSTAGLPGWLPGWLPCWLPGWLPG